MGSRPESPYGAAAATVDAQTATPSKINKHDRIVVNMLPMGQTSTNPADGTLAESQIFLAQLRMERNAVSHIFTRMIMRPALAIVLAFTASLMVNEARGADLQNDAYTVRALVDGNVEIGSKGGQSRVFAPVFTVLHRVGSPEFGRKLTTEEDYVLPTWQHARATGRTYNVFESANADRVMAATATIENAAVQWDPPGNAFFSLHATLTLPPGDADPLLTFTVTARQEGWYSVGYSGAPESKPDAVDWLWQPLIWQEKRFPRLPFLTTEDMGGLPATLFTKDRVTVAVVADPQESPFRMPNSKNARFGVAVRNAAGNVQPQIFAPVLGKPESKLKAGEAFTFRARLVVRQGDWYDTFSHIARRLYAFRDVRQNGLCSLNSTIENTIDFAMNDKYSGWIPSLKGCDYTTDVPETVKVVSSLHPLEIALITDSEAIFRQRVVPMTEYLMSRQKFLYAEREGIKEQSPSHLMKGPAMEVADLSATFLMTGSRSAVFRHYVQALYDKKRALNLDLPGEAASFQNLLALYRATGDKDILRRATNAADEYIRRRIDAPQTDLTDSHPELGGQFWTDWSPRWMMLYELYQETGNRKYLEAAAKGARLYSQYAWLFPAIPDGNVTVNAGGKVGVYQHPRGVAHPEPMRVPEQTVPAWRVSQVGLTPEASNTYASNPAVFLTHFAPWMLRIARETNDPLLHDVARSAVVGRYCNYPCYCIKGEFTTVYEPADYPLRPYTELTYNQPYYNHVWPQIAVLTDYLISDVVGKSDGNIDFPSRYAQGYVYLQSKVYGDRPGTFFGDKDVWLYLPKGLLALDTIQLNYVAAVGNNKLYVAFSNQSASAVEAKLKFDSTLAGIDPHQSYAVQVWKENKPAGNDAVKNGMLSISVGAGGMTAVEISGVTVTPKFAGRLRAPGKPASDESYALRDTPVGKVNGMILDFGAGLTEAYVYLEATEKDFDKATFDYRTGAGEWRHLSADKYPFEFSVPLADTDSTVEYRVTGINGGKSTTTEVIRLTR